MITLPITILFLAATILTVVIFYFASRRVATVLVILAVWMIVQGAISISGFYTITDTLPPRMLLLIGPALLLVTGLFFTKRGKRFADGFSLKTLTWLHIVRVPVEIGLFMLFKEKLVPETMTFEGRNFDIISGITAPVMVYLCFVRKSAGKTLLLVWNIACFVLLLNIVTTSILAAPAPFQQIDFDQPNRGVLYFPVIYLPGVIVPLVMLSHLIAFRQLGSPRALHFGNSQTAGMRRRGETGEQTKISLS